MFTFTVMFGYNGYIHYFCLKPPEKRHPFMIALTYLWPLYHVIWMCLFPIIFDPDSGSVWFLFLGFFYWYFLAFLTLICYFDLYKNVVSIWYYTNICYWIIMFGGAPVIYGISYFHQRYLKKEEIRKKVKSFPISIND